MNTTPPVCDYEGSDYQQSFWEKGNRAYEDAAEEIAIRRLLPPGSGRLLELGAGAGRNTHRYKGYSQITLLDYSTTQLAQAIERLGNGKKYRYIAADVYRLPFAPGVFDAATMIRTLHHLSEPAKAFAQINETLSDGAHFLLEFANKRNIKSIMRYWLKKQDWSSFTEEQVEFVKLNFDFHPRRVKAQLAENHFSVEKQIAVSYLRANFFKRILPLPVMKFLERILQRGFSWAALSPSIFLSTTANSGQPQAEEGVFFRCPACRHHPLADTPPLLTCTRCGATFPVKDNIYDFRMLEG